MTVDVTWAGVHPEGSGESAEHSAGHAGVLLERARHHADAVQAHL